MNSFYILYFLLLNFKMSENDLNYFLNYLYDIGLIDNNTFGYLYNTYLNLYKHTMNNNFINTMCATLIYFFNNMNEEQQKFSSLNLILKYFQNNKEKALNKLKNIIDKILHNIKLKTLEQLNKWNLGLRNPKLKIENYNNNYNDNNKYFRRPNTSKRRQQNSLKENSKFTIDENYNSSSNLNQTKSILLETSWDKKEREEYEKCTFEPSINKRVNSQPNLRKKIPVYQRLYNYNNKYENKKQMKINEIEKIENEKSSFRPNIINPPEEFKKKVKKKFEERQKIFFDNKYKHKEKLLGKLDKDFNKNYSFSPKVNSGRKIENYYINYFQLSSPVFKRLYEDDYKRRLRNKKYINELNNKIDEQCNSISKDISTVDYEKIEELYNQYKNKAINYQKVKEKVEFDEGCTFKPYLNKNNFYSDKVKSDFYERNMNTLFSKQKFINDYNQREEEKLRNMQYRTFKGYQNGKY